MFNAIDVRVFQRVIDVLFQRHITSGTHAFIRGNDQAGAGINNATGHRLRREAAEDHRVDGTNAGAGQHGHRRFRHHRHIDSHHVAFFHAQREQCIGEAANIAVQFAIANVFTLAGIVAFPDDGGLVAAGCQVAVETVSRQVQRTVFVPFDGDIAGSKGGVFNFRIRPNPVEDLSLFTPERVRVGD